MKKVNISLKGYYLNKDKYLGEKKQKNKSIFVMRNQHYLVIFDKEFSSLCLHYVFEEETVIKVISTQRTIKH